MRKEPKRKAKLLLVAIFSSLLASCSPGHRTQYFVAGSFYSTDGEGATLLVAAISEKGFKAAGGVNVVMDTNQPEDGDVYYRLDFSILVSVVKTECDFANLADAYENIAAFPCTYYDDNGNRVRPQYWKDLEAWDYYYDIIFNDVSYCFKKE